MKFTVQRTSFLKKLAEVQLAISTRTTIPILTGIKITAGADGITLTGSDSDISIETFLDAENEEYQLSIEEPGSIVLQPARFFSDIVRTLPDDFFTLEVLEHFQTAITSDTSSFTIHGLDAENYPRLPQIDEQNAFHISVPLLKQVIRQTVIAVSIHESRPILTGVNLSIQDGKMRAVATDSHRLSQRVIPLDVGDSVSENIVVPGKSLTELSRLLGDSTDEVEAVIAENQILFKTNDTYFYSRLLEGNYPNTERLIPATANTYVTLEASRLLGAIERASLLSHAGKNNVVKMTIEKGSVTITGNSPEIGRVEEEVVFKAIEGEPLEISFNPDYMKDALNTFGQVEVVLQLLSPLRPFVVVPNEDEREFIQLITPIRTS